MTSQLARAGQDAFPFILFRYELIFRSMKYEENTSNIYGGLSKQSLLSSAANCSASCPSVDTFSRFRAQSDLTVSPPGSKDVCYHCPNADWWFHPQRVTSASNSVRARNSGSTPATSLAFQAPDLPVALDTGDLISLSDAFKFAAIARWRKPTTTMVETRLKRRRAQ